MDHFPPSTKLLASHRPQVAKCQTLEKNAFWGTMIKIRPSRCGEKVGGSHLANSYQTAVHLSSQKTWQVAVIGHTVQRPQAIQRCSKSNFFAWRINSPLKSKSPETMMA